VFLENKYIFDALLIILYYKMQTGTVKFFNEEKGFGFITNDETGKDIFVHATGLRVDSLNEGDKVQFEEEEGRKGIVAAQVVVIED
jgi:CspA family cold shock protein